VSVVEVSIDGGKTWEKGQLGNDEGTYSFRRWNAQVTAPASGKLSLMVRCTNTKGVIQPDQPNWNSAGFMRNVIESAQLSVA
jgi:hypothetical protein